MSRHWSELPSDVDDAATSGGSRLPAPVRALSSHVGTLISEALRPVTKRIGASTAQVVTTGLCLVVLLAASGYWLVADDGQDPIPADAVTRLWDWYDAERAAGKRSARYDSKWTAADNDKIRIVEQGYSLSAKAYGDDRLLTYGAILKNTDRKRAAIVRVEVHVDDATGTSLIAKPDAEYTTVGYVMPGQLGGVGDRIDLNSTAVASVRLTVESVGWSRVDPKRTYNAPLSGTLRHADLVDRNATPSDDQPRAPEDLVVRFTTTSRYRGVIPDTSLVLIYRNKKGAIIGGAGDRLSAGHQIPPGVSEHEVLVDSGLPPKIDTSQIEVYPYPYLPRHVGRHR